MKNWKPFFCPRCENILMLREPAAYICPFTGQDVEKEEVALAMAREEAKGEAKDEPIPTYH